MAAESSVLWYTSALSIAAVLAAPITALWVQGKSDRSRALRERREQIFKTLWVNRRRPFYVARIDALNMIDVEFFGEAKIVDAWQDLFAAYGDNHSGLSEGQIAQQREDKYATLLYEISQVLGYKFGKTYIRDNIYRPSLHGTFDEMEFETRRRILDLLRTDALPIRFVNGQERNTAQVPPPHSDAV